MSPRSQWAEILARDPGHSQRYIDRFAMLAAQGQVILAVGAAALVAMLRDMKGELHRGMQRIAPAELDAILQLGVLTAVVLPLLPDTGFGPYGALNPFRIWLAVVPAHPERSGDRHRDRPGLRAAHR